MLCCAVPLAGLAQSSGAPEAELGAEARVERSHREAGEHEASSVVTRVQLEEQLPRSASDALRYEPGVSVQQTAHAQASPYVRGMTGQQVMHVFDGVRINNGLFRQGPNQYFFTVDAYTLERLEVVRGSSSTRYGSDALGGAILALPREPLLGEEGLTLHPRVYGRYATADTDLGGRAELETGLWGNTALLLGAGYRDAGLLRGGGLVGNDGRREPMVPRLLDDGHTQRGTGFTVATFDARTLQRIRSDVTLVAALYGFREDDAPRTDQCPPPEAPVSECLRVEEQYRTLGYVSLRGNAGDFMRDFDLNASLQRHDELRVNDRPRSFVRTHYDNDVTTLGAAFRASTKDFSVGENAQLRWRYGLEAYRDEVGSTAGIELTDPELVALGDPELLQREYSRGQYLEGSLYVQAGAFSELALSPIPWLTLYGGGRLSAAGASAARDEVSGSPGLSERYGAVVGRAGASAQAHSELALHLNLDQGFRAPNLDDLTSRQQVGPGFQFENSALTPEYTNTLEFGVVATPSVFEFEVWAFATWLDDAITRAVRERSDCPPDTRACGASRTQFQLINADGIAQIFGTEGSLAAAPLRGLLLRTTYGFAWGEGPNTGSRSVQGETPFGARVPLSRIPPFGGNVEVRYRHLPSAVYGAAVMRWALAQRRLAPSDLADARIPEGGTPGYAIFDLRAGWRLPPTLSLHIVLENLLDAAYRVHGSSINGPGRGLVLGASLGY